MRERLQNDLNERKLTIKRRYTELHPAKEVGASAKVRNKVLEAIKDGKITRAEFDKIVSELSNDSKRWLKRNAQYFNVSEDGVTLSKSGSRILNQIKTNTQPTMRKLVMESFSQFINSQEDQAINEGTRGQVGIIDKKGNIQSVYTHYDSYPDWVLPTIKKHYKNAKAVKDLIAKGNNSGLDAPGKMNFYNDGIKPMAGKVYSMDQYIKLAASDGGAEYAYLYDEAEKTWYMIDIYGDRELVPAFESFDVKSDELVLEALKSSKLRNLMNMQAAGTKYGSHNKDLTKAFYGLTKIKLDILEDSAFIDYADPKKAYKELSKDRDYVVFYIVDNEKSNPYASNDSWEYENIKPGLLALTRGKDFLGVSYDQRESQRDRSARGGKYGSTKKTLSKSETDAVGGSKKYSGYDGSGVSSIKRAAELADRAIAIHLSSGTSADSDRSARTKAREGAIAFTSGKDFKKANLARYNEILANKAAALPLDKVVEDSINLLTKHITDAFKSGEKTQYGETKIGVDKRGRDIKVTDASNIMSNLLNDYDRYVRYLADAEKEKDSGYSTGYYEKNAKQYAKSIKDRAKKIKDMNYAW